MIRRIYIREIITPWRVKNAQKPSAHVSRVPVPIVITNVNFGSDSRSVDHCTVSQLIFILMVSRVSISRLINGNYHPRCFVGNVFEIM